MCYNGGYGSEAKEISAEASMTTRQQHFWRIVRPALYGGSLICLALSPKYPIVFWIFFAVALPLLAYYEWFVRKSA